MDACHEAVQTPGQVPGTDEIFHKADGTMQEAHIGLLEPMSDFCWIQELIMNALRLYGQFEYSNGNRPDKRSEVRLWGLKRKIFERRYRDKA